MEEPSLIKKATNINVSFAEETPNLSFGSRGILNEFIRKEASMTSPFEPELATGLQSSHVIDLSGAGLQMELSPSKETLLA